MPYDRVDKWFAALTASACVLLGTVCLVALISVALAIWKAGFIVVLVWGAIFVAFFFAARVVYRAIVKNEWI